MTADHEPGPASRADTDVGPLEYAVFIWRRGWLILGLCALAMLVSYLYSIRIPKTYVAVATVLAPKEELGGAAGAAGGLTGLLTGGGGGLGQESGRGGGAAGMLGQLGSSIMPFFNSPTPNLNTSLALLRSRTLREQVVAHFKRTWGPEVESLIGGVRLEAKDDVIVLTADGRDPKLTAEVANFYFEQLQLMIADRQDRRREREYQFYLSRVEQARRDYKAAQQDLVAFQEQNRTLTIDAGTRSAIEAGAQAGGSVMALEIERELKRMSVTDQHPEMIALNKRIYELKRLMSHSLYGEALPLPPEKPGAPPRKEFFVAATKMTPLHFKMVEFYRDFRLKEAFYNFLSQNVESYKLNNRMPAPVDWLDPALPPGGPSGPRVMYNVGAAGIGALVVGIMLALFLEYVERVRRERRAVAVRVSRGIRRLAPAVDVVRDAIVEENGDVPRPITEPRLEGGRQRVPPR